MNIDVVLKSFNEIFCDVLDDEDIVLTKTTNANDIEDWDSLSHIQLVLAIEKQFDIRFTALEIEEYSNVGEMCEGVLNKKS